METEQARQMLADVEARHNDIIKLEKSLKELHDLFLEMALLVESQVGFYFYAILILKLFYFFYQADTDTDII